MAITDFDRQKKIDVRNVTGTPSISGVVPIIITAGDYDAGYDNMIGTGNIVVGKVHFGWANIASQNDIAIYDEYGVLLDYTFERFSAANHIAIVLVYRNWVRDGSTQLIVAYGNGPSDQSVALSTVFSKSNLSGAWLLNEASGDAVDATGNGHNGTVSGGITRQVDGQVGYAYTFDGVDGNIVIPSSVDFDPADGDFAWGCWFRLTDAGTNPFIVRTTGQYNYSAVSNGGFSMYQTDAPGLGAEIGDGTNKAVYNTESFNDGNWHYGLAIWDVSEKTLSLYVDGNLEGTNTNTSVGTISNTYDIQIGKSSNYYSAVDLDDIRIWKGTVSPDKQQALYDSMKSAEDFFDQQAGEWTGIPVPSVNVVPSVANNSTPARRLSHDYAGATGTKTVKLFAGLGFSDIVEIALQGCNLTGQIPTELGRCFNVTRIELQNNNFSSYSTITYRQDNGLYYDISNNANLNSDAISQLIIDLDNSEITGGTLDVRGCDGGTMAYSNLTTAGQTAKDNLDSKGWNIYMD